jgi:hypothetical protein
MSDVVYLPTGQFNLFSLTKMTTNQGWILGGDKKGIWLTKEGKKLLFNIAIPTPKGMLFAMYVTREIGREMGQAMVDEKSIPSNWCMTVSVILAKIGPGKWPRNWIDLVSRKPEAMRWMPGGKGQTEECSKGKQPCGCSGTKPGRSLP